jgi:hypothetical protein
MSQELLYPLQFEPIYQYRLWGGRRFAGLLTATLPGGLALSAKRGCSVTAKTIRVVLPMGWPTTGLAWRVLTCRISRRREESQTRQKPGCNALRR